MYLSERLLLFGNNLGNSNQQLILSCLYSILHVSISLQAYYYYIHKKKREEQMPKRTDFRVLKESEYTYDQKFKQLFQNKKFLSPILKNIVKEYKNLALEEIESLIVSVKGNEEVATQIMAEDVGKGEEAKTYYDVMVGCRLPQTQDLLMVDLYFDLEMQREKNPGYPLPKRGIYYCSRMLSHQLSDPSEEDYAQLKPVYSVWIIINDIPKVLQYSRHELSITGTNSRQEASKTYSEKKKARFNAAVSRLNSEADLIHLCLIFLAEDFTEQGASGDDLIRYLQSVFVKKAGDPQYNPYADYSKSIVKEADEVMTIVGMFEKRGELRGERRGEKRGERRGEDRLRNLFYCLKQQGREEDIDQIICEKNPQLLEKLYAEFHL